MWKKFINFLVIGALAYCLILIFSQNDKRAINNNGLSPNALVFPTKSSESLRSALAKIEHSTQDDDQFQLQFITSSDIVYIYDKGITLNLPLNEGRKFSNEDFIADVPLAIVGKDVKKNVYLNQLQNYYILGKKYISIIGFTGFRETKQLNSKVFISVNSHNLPQNVKLKQLTVVGDGPKIIEHSNKFRKIFHSSKEKKFLSSEIPIIGSGWLKHSWIFIFSDLLVMTIMIIVIAIQFETYSKSSRKHIDLWIAVIDLIFVSIALFIGLKMQYIINGYIISFVVYISTLIEIWLGHYLANYKILTI
ncbi:hypothetical protein [Xylocopilactobacillus apis]|uniref:MacB-like periplasmic core domain-containing protein n=1 Tax=Xylocopilactobacillus apis TaxID=2932183 RepID=A0AAU9DHT2_9LACO|nr:hypothetical protein [Xylocopilactobacillus apis]BDR56292.1 hypothetical protein KIMC2_08540 [Xylocopilactobacillus apis]